MTVVGFPLNAVTGAPAYTGEDMRLALSALEFGANAARPLGVRSGVRIGTPTTTASASGFTWTVANHSGIVDVQTSATAGGYLYAITAPETGAITAANATHPRRDILTIRVDDPQEDATGIPLIAVGYTAGTAAATPTVPATPARSMVLARIDTPASGGGDPTVTWLAPVAVAAGGIVPVVDDTARDALSTAYGATQTLYAHHASDGLVRWIKGGSAWVSMEPVVAASTIVTPTSVAGTGVSLTNARVDAAASASIIVNGAFTSDFRRYVIEGRLVSSAASDVTMQLRAGGVTNTAAVYDLVNRFRGLNATASAAQGAAGTAWTITPTAIAGTHIFRLVVDGPALAAATIVQSTATSVSSVLSTSDAVAVLGYQHRTASAYDGFVITAASGNVTGTLTITGLRDGS